MKGQGPDLTGEWDSDEEVPDDLPFGSRVDVKDPLNSQWVQGVVLYTCNK
jgi:hypothetical protein